MTELSPSAIAARDTTVESVFLALAIFFVIARCYTKFFLLKQPGWEDYTSITAVFLYVVYAILVFLQRWEYGGADPYGQINDGYLATGVVCAYLYTIGIALAKVSLLLFLYRIFHIDRRFRIAAYCVGFVVVIWSLVTFLMSFFSCRPFLGNYKLKVYLDPATKCTPAVADVVNIYGFCNIITDFALLVLPIPLLLKLQMDTRKKIGVAAIFATGAAICAVAIVRQYIFWHTAKGGERWLVNDKKIWLTVEFSLSIIVACFPALAPLMKISIVKSLVPSSIRSKFTNRDAHRLPKNQQEDVERQSTRPSRRAQPSHTSWQAPKAWRAKKEGSFDDQASGGSDIRLQPVLPTYREINHKD